MRFVCDWSCDVVRTGFVRVLFVCLCVLCGVVWFAAVVLMRVYVCVCLRCVCVLIAKYCVMLYG